MSIETCRSWLLAILLLGGLSVARAVPNFEALDELAPEDAYRQLSLMLLVSAGVDDAMLATLDPVLAANPDAAFDVERYTTPLARIVDQASLLAGATRLFRFTTENEAAIRERLAALEAANEGELSAALLTSVDDDTILIRQAIANSMASAGLGEAGDTLALRYGEQTVVLRNALEFSEFKFELDRLTERAIASVGGKLDAYQRMFDDETNTGTFDRRIRSAELIYLPEGQFDPKAGELTEEMLQNMVLMESAPNR